MKIIIIIILLAFIILALSFLLTFIMYRMQFGKRIDICEADKKSDIPRRKKIEFYSGKNKLTGYFYGINQTIFYKGIMPSEKGFRFSSGL